MTEDPYSAILKALMPESGGDGTAALQALLPQSAGGQSSRIQLLTTLLATQQAARIERDAQEADQDPYFWETHDPAGATGFSTRVSPAYAERRGYRRVREEVRRLRVELEELRERNETLAAALGACPRCWGGNIRCAGCQGRGSPGSKAPERRIFATFVLPAVRRVRAEQANGQSWRKERLRQETPTDDPTTSATKDERAQRAKSGKSSIEDKEDEGA